MERIARTVAGGLFALLLLLIVPIVSGRLQLVVGLWASASLVSLIGLLYATAIRERGTPAPALLAIALFALLSVAGFLHSLVGLEGIGVPGPGLDWLPTESVGLPIVLPHSFLPAWWVAGLFVPVVGLILVDLAEAFPDPWRLSKRLPADQKDPDIYSHLRVGGVMAFAGFWGVLFVTGLSLLQKIVIIAPIFEELLKFGVALVFAQLLDMDGIPTFVGLAVAMGAIFGIVEHFHTYANEGDASYLVRVLFHGVAAGVSMVVYIDLISDPDITRSVSPMAPAVPIVIHAVNNAAMIPVAVVEEVLGGVSFALPVSIGLTLALLTFALFGREQRIRDLHRSAAGFIGLRTANLGWSD